MSNDKKKPQFSLSVGVLAILVAAAVIITGCKKSSSEPSGGDDPNSANTQGQPEGSSTTTPETNTETVKTPSEPAKNLIEVVRAARNWGPSQPFAPWFGKEAPDFTLSDVHGKEHKLSDYKGKNVILVFWATWCPPCKMTVPHLMELRKTVSKDDLAVLALSHITEYPPNTAQMIGKYASDTKINYTVLAVKAGDAGDPYDSVGSLPTFFFIDRQGKIKLVASGLMTLGAFNSVLEAEWPKEAF